MKRIFLAAILLAATSNTFAQTATPGVRHRQVRQQQRIGQGVNSGSLTPRETGHLEAREAKIQQDKQAAKSDGVVTGRERAKLHREENRASRAIYRQKHDAQVAH